MSGLNKQVLIGHVGKDPEIRYTQGGEPIASFSVAVTERWGKGPEKKEHTEWFQCTAFSPLAEIVSKYVTKGKQVYLEGNTRTEEWTDREGHLQKAKKVMVRQLVLLGGGGQREPEPAMVAAGAAKEEDDEVPF